MSAMTRLVLFSGWGVDARVWQPLISSLTSLLDAHASPLPHGHSLEILTPDWPHPASRTNTALLSELGGAHSLWLGWSLGALRAEALTVSLTAEQKPGARISLAMGPHFVQSSPSDIQTTFPALPADTLTTFANAFTRSPEASWQHFLRWQASGETDAPGCLKQLRALIGTQTSHSPKVLSAGLAELASRTMALSQQEEFWLGKHDPLLAPGLTAVLREQGHHVTEFDGGHCLPVSHHEAIAEALLKRMAAGGNQSGTGKNGSH
ncbi:alpha/beta fold hydrolase [Cobetia sp. L2A1]|uniref:alpha/beta fold hydrolase n=1 Tax=Cobetia sp. L2A1 TaxID=2686360 RepID=UPI00131B40EA|nr:alpha/beta fold hydrolase [Cobetia sp. L2A1]